MSELHVSIKALEFMFARFDMPEDDDVAASFMVGIDFMMCLVKQHPEYAQALYRDVIDGAQGGGTSPMSRAVDEFVSETPFQALSAVGDR